MVSESKADNLEVLLVIDLINHSNQSSLSHSVSSPVVNNQPKYDAEWFKYLSSTVSQFRQNEHDYFAILSENFRA